MGVLRVDFDELYRRHLRRHSQYGNNVIHITAVVGIWFVLLAVACAVGGSIAAPIAISGLYLVVLLANVPVRVLLMSAFVLPLLTVLVYWLPTLPLWAYVLLVIPLYQVQQLGHRFYRKELDMSAFTMKYRKGVTLFILLAAYQLPILMNYLAFDRESWST